eukprot:1045882-Rhodomonas_salina.2
MLRGVGAFLSNNSLQFRSSRFSSGWGCGETKEGGDEQKCHFMIYTQRKLVTLLFGAQFVLSRYLHSGTSVARHEVWRKRK